MSSRRHCKEGPRSLSHLRMSFLFSFKVITFCQLSVLRCHLYLFSPEKLTTFFSHHYRFHSFHSFTRVSSIDLLIDYLRHVAMLPIICRSSCGALFCGGGAVRPNMLNMPKSAADSPGSISVKILPCQQMATVPNGVEIAENFNRLSRVHQRYRRQTDGR